MAKKIVDLDTGEIKEIVRYTTKEQDHGMKKKILYDSTKMEHEEVAGRNFSLLDMEFIESSLPEVKEEHLKVFGACLVLSSYLSLDGNSRLPHKSITEIAESLCLDRKNASSILQIAIELNLMQRKEDGWYLNTELVRRGKDIDAYKTVKVYHRAMRQLPASQSLNHVGFLALIIPFISYDYWCVCTNPTEEDIDRIDRISTIELANKLHLDRSTVHRNFRSMAFRYGNMELSVFATWKTLGKEMIVVNPLLFTRKVSDRWKGIIDLFIVSRR